jgi:hypothetical protein
LAINFKRAEDGIQTRDPQLGRLMLYQLSYFRKYVGEDGFEPPKAEPTDLQSVPFGHSGIHPKTVIAFAIAEKQALLFF